MTGLTRRFLVIMVAIVLTLSLGAFAIPALPVEAQSGSANVNFGTQYNYAVSGNSFSNTDAPVTGNEDWGSGLNGPSIALNNVNLNLASSTSFDNENPTPVITGSYNYLWAVGNLTPGGSYYTRVGLNNSPVTYTPGFDASRSVDNTTFTVSGTQTLTVSVTPRQAFPNGLGIGVNVQEDQHVNATIESITPLDGAPLDNYYLSPDGRQMNININNPTEGTTYTYTIIIQLNLQAGVTQLDFMPSVGVTSQFIVSKSLTDTSSVSDSNGAGTWTWSSDDSITWNWNEVLTQGVSFEGYSNSPNPPISPSANVNFSTNYNGGVSGNSYANATDAPVTGNENWGSNLNLNSIPSLDSVKLKLASSTSFDNFGGPIPPTVTGSTGAYNYEWDFGTVSTGGGIAANVGLNNSPISFKPGFDASRSVDNTTFTVSGTQTLTVSVTPRQAFQGIGIGVNLPEDQHVNATIASVTALDGAPLNNYVISPDKSNMNININNPTEGTTYTYTITIQVNLHSGVAQLDYMPGVNVNANQSVASGSVTDNSSVSDTNNAGTWTWSSTDNIIWNWNENLSQGINFPGYSNTPGAPSSPSVDVAFSTNYICGVSGDSFINDNGQVTGNEDWASNLGGGIITLTNVNLNLASNKIFNYQNQPTNITGPTIAGIYNYLWYFGNPTVGYPTGGTPYAQIGTFPATFMPGFNASRSANQTKFTASGIQTLIVSVTPKEALRVPGGIDIGMNVSEDQCVNPTIESVTPTDNAPTNDVNLSPDGHSLRIGISNPTKDITYTYTITIQVNLQPGVTQLDYMPEVHMISYQSESNGSVTDTSSVSDTNDAGTWTWSSDDSITWNWSEVLNKGVYFQSYETATITTSTTISGGGVSVPVQNNGVAVGITGSTAPSGTGVTISSTNYGNTQPSGTGAIQLSGSLQYYDVNVSSSSGLGAGATAKVSITSPSVTADSTMQYWYNGIWNGASDVLVSGTTITGDIPVSALGGTPFVIGNGPSITIKAPVNGTVYYLNQAVNANWNVTDSLPFSVSGTGPSGSPINTSKVGNYSFTVSAKDNAGNTATSTVNYSVCGNAITALSGNINIGNSTNVTSSSGLSIGGNLLANGNISLGNSIKINGNASASGNITKGNSTVISGAVKPNADVINFSGVNTSPYLTSASFSIGGTVAQSASYANGGTISNAETLMHGNLSLNNSKTLTVNGNLYADSGSITIGNSSTLIINGNLYIANGALIAGNSAKITVTGTVYMSGNLQAGNSATLSLGKVVWVGGGITLGSTSTLSGPQTIVAYSNIMFGNSDVIGNPQMQLIISTNGGISLGTSAQLSGYLYAPTTGASIGNSANVTGSIIAKSVTIGNNCLITYGGN